MLIYLLLKSDEPMLLRSSSSFSPARLSTPENPGITGGIAGVTGDAGLRFQRLDRLLLPTTLLSGMGDKLPRDPIAPGNKIYSLVTKNKRTEALCLDILATTGQLVRNDKSPGCFVSYGFFLSTLSAKRGIV